MQNMWSLYREREGAVVVQLICQMLCRGTLCYRVGWHWLPEVLCHLRGSGSRQLPLQCLLPRPSVCLQGPGMRTHVSSACRGACIHMWPPACGCLCTSEGTSSRTPKQTKGPLPESGCSQALRQLSGRLTDYGQFMSCAATSRCSHVHNRIQQRIKVSPASRSWQPPLSV